MEAEANPEKRRRGRPCVFTPELGAEICERLSEGETLVSICRDEHMPQAGTVRAWSSEDRRPPEVPASFVDDVARARRNGADANAEETVAIADYARNDWMERHGKDAAGWVLNGEHVQRSKLRIWTRLQLLEKWDPRYRAQLRQEITGKDGGPVQTEDMTPNEVARRIAFALAQGLQQKKEP